MESVSKHSDIKLVTTKQEKGLFSVRTKLSYDQMVFIKFNCNRNEKNKSKNE